MTSLLPGWTWRALQTLIAEHQANRRHHHLRTHYLRGVYADAALVARTAPVRSTTRCARAAMRDMHLPTGGTL